MRSLEDFLPEDVSEEDEQPSTDTSEDSVEVSVTPIRPNCSQLSRLPRKFRKAFEKDVPISSPVDFSVTSLSRSPELAPRGVSQESLKTGSFHRSKANRRKLSEPRRVVDHEPKEVSGDLRRSHEEVSGGLKRSHEEISGDLRRSHDEVSGGLKRSYQDDWVPRKAHKSDGPLTILRPPQKDELNSQPNILGPNPFLGHFVPPHLLLPPVSWPHMGRYPYTHLVGTVLGPPLGLLPAAPYPLLPILPPHHAQASVSPIPKSEGASTDDNHFRLNVSSPAPSQRIPSTAPSLVEKSGEPYTKKSSPKGPSNKKFLSVESFLNTTETKPELKALEIPHVPLTPMGSSDTDTHHESTDFLPPSPTASDINIQSLMQCQPKQKQRNYKNMTRERRIEANARERTRVHTISAAFETLRRAVPSFSHNQKLSKLSVLRIASAYILSLSRLAGHDYSEDRSSPSFEECVDLTTKTIQVEGKAKKKRDE